MLLEKIRHYLAIWVYADFSSQQEIIHQAIDNWDVSWEKDERPKKEFRPFLERTTSELFDQYHQEQKRWPEVTDCDQLDAAFAELDQIGVLARQNYEQTLTSGRAAIEAEAVREQTNRPIRGFVFYHEQDTESAVARNSGPVLAWGALEEGDDAWNRVAQTIITVLNRHGIQTDWHGEPNSRIFITSLKWQRRRQSTN